MPADPRDQFAGFTGEEHLFLLIDDPLRMIRDQIEHDLREQVPDTILHAIVMEGEAKFLTVGARTSDDAMTVQHFGFCLRARLTLGHDGGEAREELDATLTFLFGHLDRPGQQQLRTYFDLHADAVPAYADDVFDDRFEELRSDLSSPS